MEVLKMFKVNLKNYVVIILIVIVLLFLLFNFDDICNTITKTFRL
jgi:hypothetical protein